MILLRVSYTLRKVCCNSLLPSFLCIKLLIYGIYYNSKCNIWRKLEETWSWFEILSVCTTICDKIKMFIHKKLEKRKFTLFSVYSKRSFYKMFCHMCKSRPTEKLIKLLGKKYFYAYFLFGIFESFYSRCKFSFAILYLRAKLIRI